MLERRSRRSPRSRCRPRPPTRGSRTIVRREALDRRRGGRRGRTAPTSKARRRAPTNAATERRGNDPPLRRARAVPRPPSAELEAVEARLAADAARYAEDPDDRRVALLTLRAGLAERRAAARQGRARPGPRRAVAGRRPRGPQGRRPQDASRPSTPPRRRWPTPRKAVEDGGKALDGPLPTSYAPLTPVRPATSTGRRLALARAGSPIRTTR